MKKSPSSSFAESLKQKHLRVRRFVELYAAHFLFRMHIFWAKIMHSAAPVFGKSIGHKVLEIGPDRHTYCLFLKASRLANLVRRTKRTETSSLAFVGLGRNSKGRIHAHTITKMA
jgi:hypothetical protein